MIIIIILAMLCNKKSYLFKVQNLKVRNDDDLHPPLTRAPHEKYIAYDFDSYDNDTLWRARRVCGSSERGLSYELRNERV